MRLHLETKPKGAGFIKDFPRKRDRRDLAEVLTNQFTDYELDWAAVYINDKQIMFYDMKSLIKALQYDIYQ